MLEQRLLFTGFSSIQFFNLTFFSNAVSYTKLGSLYLTMQLLCDLRDTLPPHWPPSALSTLTMCFCPHS